MKHIFTVLAILALCVSSFAQSFKLDVQRPSYEGFDAEGLSHVGYLAHERNVLGFDVGVEVGWSYLSYAGDGDFALLNPRVYLKPLRSIPLKYSFYLPLVDETNLAGAVAIASQFVPRLENFIPNAIVQRLEYSASANTPLDLALTLSAGLSPIIYTGERVYFADDFEMFVPVVVGLTDRKGLLSLSVFLEGNYFATEKSLSFAEATAVQARLEAGYKFGGLSLAGYLVLPVDSETKDVLQNAVGIKVGF